MHKPQPVDKEPKRSSVEEVIPCLFHRNFYGRFIHVGSQARPTTCPNKNSPKWMWFGSLGKRSSFGVKGHLANESNFNNFYNKIQLKKCGSPIRHPFAFGDA